MREETERWEKREREEEGGRERGRERDRKEGKRGRDKRVKWEEKCNKMEFTPSFCIQPVFPPSLFYYPSLPSLLSHPPPPSSSPLKLELAMGTCTKDCADKKRFIFWVSCQKRHPTSWVWVTEGGRMRRRGWYRGGEGREEDEEEERGC